MFNSLFRHSHSLKVNIKNSSLIIITIGARCSGHAHG